VVSVRGFPDRKSGVGVKRTSRLRVPTSEFDPQLTSPALDTSSFTADYLC
jgi:hypothetical protein